MNQLEKVRKYEIESEKMIPEEQRPVFHVSSRIGWMNDPNGFSMYKGEYHLFYQYYPYDIHWGPMHWAHVISKDLIKWEVLPAALAPDEAYESGCFSGSALELEDGRQMLMYTAHLEKENEDTGAKKITESQCIAFGDGVDFEKYHKNPVITADMLPADFSDADFRDPKIWKEEDGFYCVAVGKSRKDGGAILLFHSEDGLQWNYVSTLDKSKGNYGVMWECPDLFTLGGKTVLITSPMEMFAKGLEFHNGHGIIYLVGKYNQEKHAFDREYVKSLEYGLDFYAPQTTLTEDGRRILIGWMQSWDNYMTPQDYKWSGMMTVPRELSMKEGRICQLPVREIAGYYQNPVSYDHVTVHHNEKQTLAGVRGRVLDMEIMVKEGSYRNLTVNLAQNEKYVTCIRYNRDENTVTFDRRFSGMSGDMLENRSFYVKDADGRIKLRILLDRYSVELFVNDGEQACTSLIYTPQEVDGISFETDGEFIMNVRKYDIVVS